MSELHFEHQMSDAEALMWHLEQDPWFSSTFGAISLLEHPLDAARLRARMTRAVAIVPRLRERVSAGTGRLTPPRWVPDAEFDLDDHLRHIVLPEPGSLRDLLDLATRLVADPFDRNAPLWRFWIVDGVEGGRGALITKLHHTITDGEGGIRLAEAYMDFSADAEEVAPVDLDEVVARAVAAAAEGDDDAAGSGEPIGLNLLRHLGQARRFAGEVAVAMADPGRIPEIGGEVLDQVTTLLGQVLPSSDGPAGSSLWSRRSRRRRLETVSTELHALIEAAHRHDAKLNDAFLCAVSDGAARYHAEVGAEVDAFRSTFVVSTRGDAPAGVNAFTPVRAALPGGSISVGERMAAVKEATSSAKSAVSGSGFMASAAGLANLLPTSVVAGFARQQAARVDFATSNVRAAPIPTWVGGAPITANYPIGPVAGTAFNATLMSYCDRVDIGLHIDPAAVAEPELLKRCVDEGFAALHG